MLQRACFFLLLILSNRYFAQTSIGVETALFAEPYVIEDPGHVLENFTRRTISPGVMFHTQLGKHIQLSTGLFAKTQKDVLRIASSGGHYVHAHGTALRIPLLAGANWRFSKRCQTRLFSGVQLHKMLGTDSIFASATVSTESKSSEQFISYSFYNTKWLLLPQAGLGLDFRLSAHWFLGADISYLYGLNFISRQLVMIFSGKDLLLAKGITKGSGWMTGLSLRYVFGKPS